VQRSAFDLQAHSTHSDGALPAAAVVARAAAAGVELFALTDHDTVDGVDDAIRAAAGLGLRVLPAVELSAAHGPHDDLHVLGYGIDPADPLLCARLLAARRDRELRVEHMCERLVDLGWAVDDELLVERRRNDKPVGRPHLAAAVLAHPANAVRLARDGHADSSAFLAAYLVAGGAAHVSRTLPTVVEAIGWIHDAGGVAVWAHPFWDVDAATEVAAALEVFCAAGLDGVEAFYVAHNAEQTRFLVEQAEALHLLTTGSSDFHGPEHPIFAHMRAFSLHGHEPRLGRLAR
jgi:predicted metal-dependent phosphoesterase TrpH